VRELRQVMRDICAFNDMTTFSFIEYVVCACVRVRICVYAFVLWCDPSPPLFPPLPPLFRQ